MSWEEFEAMLLRQALEQLGLQVPVPIRTVSSDFFDLRYGGSRPHGGYDIPADSGVPIRAVCSGVVFKVNDASRGGAGGNEVVIDHGSFATVSSHASAFAPGIAKTVRVKAGQVVAYVGSTGHATGPHLHIEFIVKGRQVPVYIGTFGAYPIPGCQ
jgi:murein DD-endopeptidase MepM/ murein hydrolase activator NlpD